MTMTTLPSRPRKKLKLDHLVNLVEGALREGIQALRILNPPPEPFQVWRTSANSAQFEVLERPNLLTTVIAAVANCTTSPASQALLDYLWEQGAHPLVLQRDDGTPPQRMAWEQGAIANLVALPLTKLLGDVSIRALHATGAWRDWEVSESSIQRMALWVASSEMHDGAWIHGIVPMLNVVLLQGVADMELEPGIWLRTWTSADSAVYLNSSGQRLDANEITWLTLSTATYVEFTLPMVEPKPAGRLDHNGFQLGAEDLLSRVMARVKWALMLSAPGQPLPIETVPVVESFGTPVGYFPIRRQALQHSWQSMGIDGAAATEVQRLLRLLLAAEKRFPELESALWLLDRSTRAELPRDVLLEATIGLERVLVPDSGENTRRFKQYGAALMGDFGLVQTLGTIYSIRSTVAHQGVPGKKDKVLEHAPLARTYLAQCIERVGAWLKAGYFGVEPAALNKSIENYLVKKMCASSVNAIEVDLNAVSEPAATTSHEPQPQDRVHRPSASPSPVGLVTRIVVRLKRLFAW